MAMNLKEIESMIKEALPDAIIDIQDLAGDGNHYSATIASSAFNGKSKIFKVVISLASLFKYLVSFFFRETSLVATKGEPNSTVSKINTPKVWAKPIIPNSRDPTVLAMNGNKISDNK